MKSTEKPASFMTSGYHFYIKESEALAADNRPAASLLFRAAVCFALSFSVLWGATKTVPCSLKIWQLALICIVGSALFTALWTAPVPVLLWMLPLALLGSLALAFLDNGCRLIVDSVIRGETTFINAMRKTADMLSNRPVFCLLLVFSVFLLVASGILVRRGSVAAFCIAAAVAAFAKALSCGTDLVTFFSALIKVWFWELIFVTAVLVFRAGGIRSAEKITKNRLLLIKFNEISAGRKNHRRKNTLKGRSILAAAVYAVPLAVFLWFAALASVVGRLRPLTASFSAEALAAFFKENVIYLVFLALIAAGFVAVAAFRVREQNSVLNTLSKRIRQSNRRRALQDIGEAAGRLATWRAGSRVTPWDDSFVVKTASVMPQVSGIELERLRDLMLRVRYGRDEIMESEYQASMELYQKMLTGSGRKPSDAARRRMRLPI